MADVLEVEGLKKSFGAEAIKGRSGFKQAREDQAVGDAPSDKAPAKAG